MFFTLKKEDLFGFCKKETPLSITKLGILRGVEADVFLHGKHIGGLE